MASGAAAGEPAATADGRTNAPGPSPAVAVEGAALTVAALARRLGVAPATLRTWDRRYGLGPSEHASGTHRRYTAQDAARVTLMRRLVVHGVSPGEAARVARSASGDVLAGAGTWFLDPPTDALPARAVTPARTPTRSPPGEPALPADRDTPDRHTPDRHRPDRDVPDRHTPDRHTPGASAATELPDIEACLAPHAGSGGRVLALGSASQRARGLARAAMSMDAQACLHAARDAVERLGVVEAWETVLVPVLVAAGRRWEITGEGVEIEHLLSESVLAALRPASSALGAPRNGRPVLLACADEEQHSLPVHVLAAALAEHGVGARVLGARVPSQALAASVRRVGPAAVFVWSQLEATACPQLLASLPAVRPGPSVFVGGPGWTPADLPSRVQHLPDLPTAVARVGAAAGV